MLIKWLSPGIDRVTVEEAENFGATGNGREGDNRRNEPTSDQYSCFCISFQLHSSCRNFFFSCSYYPSTFELSWLYNEISSWDKMCHCGAVLPTGSVAAANSLIRTLTCSSWSPSWKLSWDLPSFLKWKPKVMIAYHLRLWITEWRMFLCWFFLPPTRWPECEPFHWGSGITTCPEVVSESVQAVCPGFLPKLRTRAWWQWLWEPIFSSL